MKMPAFLKKVTVLDVLILVAVALTVYLAYVYLSNEAPAYDAVVHPVLKNTNVNRGNEPIPLEMNVNNVPVNGPAGKEKLRAANKKGDHLLLDQKDVKDKSNYICNKECPCDERTIGESLEDIRKQFLSPTKSFYGNVNRSLGVSLEDGFKAQDGKEHMCHLKKMDEDVVNSVLGCKSGNNLNLNLNLNNNTRSNRNNNNNNRNNNGN